MVTKAVVLSVNNARNRCVVRMPLFESASNPTPVKAEALISITPGLFNNIFTGDIVFVAFEENALEKPIIIGKLFLNTTTENNTQGGAGILNTLKVREAATIPSSTLFEFPDKIKKEYEDLKTPKKMADYIKWLEAVIRKIFNQIDENFRCFKNWVQWQLQPENVEVDDGDLDTGYNITESFKYQKENAECKICGNKCTRNKIRKYHKLETINKKFPYL